MVQDDGQTELVEVSTSALDKGAEDVCEDRRQKRQKTRAKQERSEQVVEDEGRAFLTIHLSDIVFSESTGCPGNLGPTFSDEQGPKCLFMFRNP